MKRVLIFVIPLLFGMSSCSNQLNLKEDVEEIIEPVSMQEYSLENTSSELLNLSWDDIQVLAKTILIENGIIEDYTDYGSKYFPDVAMIVNSKELLKDVVVLSNMGGVEDHHYQWPEIDFDRYSLVIGQFYTTESGWGIIQQYIKRSLSKSVLCFDIALGLGGYAYLSTPTNNFFAVLYPKLPDGVLEAKRLSRAGLVKK